MERPTYQMRPDAIRPVLLGTTAALLLLAFYSISVGAISGTSFLASQLKEYWYFLGALASGFGIQVGLYAHLKELIRSTAKANAMLGMTGATSTAAMISCCAHYLVNFAPFLGAVGLVSFVAQYQTELFWWGMIFNLMGIIYIVLQITKIKRK